jgi:malate dehydrogenase (oxaloacetate-decarboxylating)
MTMGVAENVLGAMPDVTSEFRSAGRERVRRLPHGGIDWQGPGTIEARTPIDSGSVAPFAKGRSNRASRHPAAASNRLGGSIMIDIQEVLDERSGEAILEIPLRGRSLLDCSLLNKGSAFSEEERSDFSLVGLLPARVSTLEEQAARRYRDYVEKPTDLERFLFLRALQDRNETLYYRLLADHVAEVLPVIYTPEVGEICQRYSHLYHRPRGLFLSYPQRHEMDALLANRPYCQVDVIVVTDGERILGLGDQGVGGLGIPVGKLALYTLCGGIDPGRTLPIVLDVGTDNAERLSDPDYLGWRHERVRGEAYDAFIEAFVRAVERHLPDVLLQWEDFAQANARRLLDRYRDRLCTFNDDLQGPAAITLAALLAGARRTGRPLREQRVVLVGAGSAGTGVSDLLVRALAEEGLTQPEAKARLWLLSSRGLVHTGLPGLSAWQQSYCRPQEEVAGWQRDPSGAIPLPEVVQQVRPTALIGVSGQPGVFTEEVVRAMASSVELPLIFPLSNPTSKSEAAPADLVAWTEGRALIATGSPFASVAYRGRTLPISQCNNSYVFPGLGMGVIASGARRVTDEMFLAAARVVADWGGGQPGTEAPLLPPVEDIREVARRVARAVGLQAQRQGLAQPGSPEDWDRALAGRWWEPRYRRLRYRA